MKWQALIEEYENESGKLISGIIEFISKEQKKGKIIYPDRKDIFRAFDLTPFEKVKVIILGQDPYYNPGQADGLAFSVPRGVKKPPSLRNIFKELHKDLKIPEPEHGNLSKWAEQGVLLLNTILTVEKDKPMSHEDIGWQELTTFILKKLAKDGKPKVFLLWGKRYNYILDDSEVHKNSLILKCGHPSPLSYRFYMDNNHFSISNKFLEKHGVTPINWDIDGNA